MSGMVAAGGIEEGQLLWVVGVGFAALLLFMFPRQFLLTLVGLVAVGGAAIYLMNEAGQRNNQIRQADLNSIKAIALHDATKCSDADYPLFVSFVNNNKKTLEKVWFSLHGSLPRHSEPVLSERNLTSDRIIEPLGSYGACWSLSHQPPMNVTLANLEWRIDVSMVSFRDQ